MLLLLIVIPSMYVLIIYRLVRVRDPLFINAEKNPYLRNVVSFLQHEFEIKCRRPRDELGKFVLQFGMVNDSNNFGYSINYDFSGIYLVFHCTI